MTLSFVTRLHVTRHIHNTLVGEMMSCDIFHARTNMFHEPMSHRILVRHKFACDATHHNSHVGEMMCCDTIPRTDVCRELSHCILVCARLHVTVTRHIHNNVQRHICS